MSLSLMLISLKFERQKFKQIKKTKKLYGLKILKYFNIRQTLTVRASIGFYRSSICPFSSGSGHVQLKWPIN